MIIVSLFWSHIFLSSMGFTSSPTVYLRPDTLWLLLFLFFFCGTMIFPIIGLLLHPGLDYLIITTLLYTFTCRAVTVSYFFNTTASKSSNKCHLSMILDELIYWGWSHLLYSALHVTCDTCLLQISRQQGSCVWRRQSEQTVCCLSLSCQTGWVYTLEEGSRQTIAIMLAKLHESYRQHLLYLFSTAGMRS